MPAFPGLRSASVLLFAAIVCTAELGRAAEKPPAPRLPPNALRTRKLLQIVKEFA